MDNKDRENLICFLAKFQGGGEPSKDILSRYSEPDLVSDVWIPLQKLLAEVEGYAKDIAGNIFTGIKGTAESQEIYTYGYIEALSVCGGKGIEIVGKASNDIDGFNLMVDHYWRANEQGKKYGLLWRQCCFVGRASPLSANDLDFWIPLAFRIEAKSQKIERVLLHKVLDQLDITPKVIEKQIGDLAECYIERWTDF